MPERTQEELAETLRKVFAKAQTDSEYRQLCLQDGNAAVEQVAPRFIPAGVEFTFTEGAGGGGGGADYQCVVRLPASALFVEGTNPLEYVVVSGGRICTD